jgi:ribonucleoside-triphosphate reductase
MAVQSLRAKLVQHRTYLRAINDEGTKFETPQAALDRQIEHQHYLWENAKKAQFHFLKVQAEEAVARGNGPLAGELYNKFVKNSRLNLSELGELAELRDLLASRKCSLSGRVKWMAGTSVIKERPASAFNCSFTDVVIPADLVDIMWLLLQGCGVGFKPKPGLLTGFSKEMEIGIIPSTRKKRGGREKTIETFDGTTWTISFGDSAKGWAKGVGKLTAHKPMAKKLVIDLSQLRPAGQRLRGYGWISSGWEPFADGLMIICDVMNAFAGKTLDAIAIGDIVNALGTVLSSRRSAQIWMMEDDSPELADFMVAKNRDENGDILFGRKWREQSNNSIGFNKKPTKSFLHELLNNVLKGGEPGLYNLEAARIGAPWVQGTNPCGEIKLPSKGFCNLVQVVWSRFNNDFDGLKRATYIMARANYRQTLVDMRDGVLQLQWQDNNKLLRLCGVSPTGIMGSDLESDPVKVAALKIVAVDAANSMADEVGQNRPALVTQVQPAGTSSKALGEEGDEVQEGAHLSPSRFLLNNINFSRHDPIVEKARAANYTVFDHPTQPASVIIAIPVAFPASPSYRKVTLSNGDVAEVTTESAVTQLERYQMLMTHWVQHNCSITISYDSSEIDDIVNWLYAHWDTYIGVSFMHRNDPTKTAEELGFKYLPQEAISEDHFNRYLTSLLPIDLSTDGVVDGIDELTACTVGGACPIK